MQSTLSYRFGPYQLDPYQRILLHEGRPVHLDPQSFEVLHVLVQNQGKILKRSDLLKAAWDAYVDDGALKYQIHRLRSALGDDPAHPTYIETVKSRGIRFKADVKVIAQNRPGELSEADRLYLKGRYLWHKSTSESVRKAIGYFERAVAADPNYAAAYVGIADSWVLAGSFGHQSVPAREAMAKAEEAASKALDIDDRLPDGHAAMASVKALYRWDWPTAERMFEYAIERSPNPMLRAWFALCLAAHGDRARARGQADSALAIDPTSPVLNALSGRVHYIAREYDQAVEQSRHAIDLEEYFYLSRLFLGHALRAMGDHTAALIAFESAAQLTSNHPTVTAELGHSYALIGDDKRALETLDELARLRSRGEPYVSPYLLAHVYIGLDDRERAFKWLELAFEHREAYLIFLATDPIYDRLRIDSRFTELVKRVNFSSQVAV